MNLYNATTPDLAIGELARKTGVGVSTIRAWERRYGFPVPQRLDSGHRRYSERDVDALRSALRQRREGASIGVALARSKTSALGPRSSVFGALRHALPDVAAAALSKRGVLALSRAMEDEIAGRADLPILIGAFQHERFWRASEARWRNLATTSTVTIAVAALRRRRRGGQVWEVPLDPATPVAREWVVVCDSPSFSTCLAAVELPDAAERTFEVLWTTEPIVVREVARVAAEIACAREPALDEIVRNALKEPVVTNHDSPRTTTALSNRVVAYMDMQRRQSA